MTKEIGSDYWLNRNQKLKRKEFNLDFLNIDFTDVAYLSTGRSAISLILEDIASRSDKSKVVLLPSFTCHTVIEPFVKADYKVVFYQLDKDLSIDKDKFQSIIKEQNPSVVLLLGYFGFDTLGNLKDFVAKVRESGIFVIEDITQSIYSTFNHTISDYYMFSLRKWAALPDGGVALSKDGFILDKPKETDKKLEDSKLDAFHAKYLYIEKNKGQKKNFLTMLGEAEKILSKQSKIYAMSDASKKIQANLDIQSLIKKRRTNYSLLAESLASSKVLEPIFPKLFENITPLYFPIYVNGKRKELQLYLAKKKIFAPVIWPQPIQIEEVIDSETEWIYDHVLAIPCDQRYNQEDMKRIIKEIRNYEDKTNEIIIGGS